MSRHFGLVGIGVGPFNLSLASLLSKAPAISSVFLERKPAFDWHSELMFSDSFMQTSFLKDLVTPVDPTHPHSFLNYLVENGLYYAFMNTGRQVVSRREFEMYCQWVSQQLGDRLRFDTPASEIRFDGDKFRIETPNGEFTSDHLCVATGLTPRVPAYARDFIGPDLFHAKSDAIRKLDLTGKRVAIIGGGQTGIEVFRNAFNSKWGRPKSVSLLTRRQSLEPLDESAFTNEYFTPGYMSEFWKLSDDKKRAVVSSQKLASDGNTPGYVSKVYNELYQLKYVERDPLEVSILACRELQGIVPVTGGGYRLALKNLFSDQIEEAQADVVILCTGFVSQVPGVLDPLREMIPLDSDGRFEFTQSFAIRWNGPARNRIYALNFSRHSHGIAEPQTSLMSWRSATIVNDLAGEKIYLRNSIVPNFVSYTAK